MLVMHHTSLALDQPPAASLEIAHLLGGLLVRAIGISLAGAGVILGAAYALFPGV
jgi:hypothetical protein